MKLSETTLSVLKNFANINPGLVFKVGNSLRTISTNKALYAEATVEESFPREFGIYDLNKLLGVLSLHENADLNFADQYLELGGVGGRSRTRIRYTEAKLIQSPPEGKSIKAATYDVSLKLSASDLLWIEKIGAVLKCPYVVISNTDGKIVVEAADVKGEIVDDSALTISDSTTATPFKFVLKVENLKLLPGDYEVFINSKGISKFVGTPVTYFVAVEQSSSFYGESKAA